SLALALPAMADVKQLPDGLYLLATDYVNTGNRSAVADLAKDWMQLTGVHEDWSIKFAVLLAKNGAAREAAQILERINRSGRHSFALAFNLRSEEHTSEL